MGFHVTELNYWLRDESPNSIDVLTNILLIGPTQRRVDFLVFISSSILEIFIYNLNLSII